MKYYIFNIWIFFSFASLEVNPFLIHFDEKQSLTPEDFQIVQNSIKKIDIDSILTNLYADCDKNHFAEFDDFRNRCYRGIRQVLLDIKTHQIPSTTLHKINKGSKNCIVSSAPFLITHNGEKPSTYRIKCLREIKESLEISGFDGYFLEFRGGYPNPTGKEIQYAAIPYSFKIFCMLEAYKLGFDNVLWIDSVCISLKNPTNLFNWIEKNGALLDSSPMDETKKKYIFPKTQQLLDNLTSTHLFDNNYICTVVFGLKMNHILTLKLISNYYEMCDLGFPFFSCFPEEFVLSSILAKKEYKKLHKYPYEDRIVKGKMTQINEPLNQLISNSKSIKSFFIQRIIEDSK